MSHLTELESFCRLALLSSLVVMGLSYFYKDQLPPPDFYDQVLLKAPLQVKTDRQPFQIAANGEHYIIKPLYDYHLNGVVVTYNDADAFGNIWHHRRWRDFINLRDLCVIWGDNVQSGIYKKLRFSSDSWTCWVSWDSREVGRQFQFNQLSNNHVLVDDPWIKRALLNAEPGDQIQFSGLLAEYENPDSGFKRGTSVTRDDTGDGACETVYLEDFQIIKKANPGWRLLYSLAKWTAIISLIATLILLFVAPHGKYRSKV